MLQTHPENGILFLFRQYCSLSKLFCGPHDCFQNFHPTDRAGRDYMVGYHCYARRDNHCHCTAMYCLTTTSRPIDSMRQNKTYIETSVSLRSYGTIVVSCVPQAEAEMLKTMHSLEVSMHFWSVVSDTLRAEHEGHSPPATSPSRGTGDTAA